MLVVCNLVSILGVLLGPSFLLSLQCKYENLTPFRKLSSLLKQEGPCKAGKGRLDPRFNPSKLKFLKFCAIQLSYSVTKSDYQSWKY